MADLGHMRIHRQQHRSKITIPRYCRRRNPLEKVHEPHFGGHHTDCHYIELWTS